VIRELRLNDDACVYNGGGAAAAANAPPPTAPPQASSEAVNATTRAARARAALARFHILRNGISRTPEPTTAEVYLEKLQKR
jgi:hypothetical protein